MSAPSPLTAGAPIEFTEFPAVTREMLRSYADASGDPNPIHLDDEVARRMGLPGIIAHGMLSAAWLAERARRFAAEEAADDGSAWKLTSFQCRFKAMVRLGDVVSIGGAVRDADARKLCLELTARNTRGETASSATVEFSR